MILPAHAIEQANNKTYLKYSQRYEIYSLDTLSGESSISLGNPYTHDMAIN